jgi:hypothetical protein
VPTLLYGEVLAGRRERRQPDLLGGVDEPRAHSDELGKGELDLMCRVVQEEDVDVGIRPRLEPPVRAGGIDAQAMAVEDLADRLEARGQCIELGDREVAATGHHREHRAGGGSARCPRDAPYSQRMARPDVYISADVETDGPIPGPYSMLSFALTVVGRFDGHAFERVPDRALTFAARLQPISEEFEPEALEVNRLNREELIAHGTAPEEAMNEAGAWVRDQVGAGRAVLVAYPVAFDWSFLYWYFERFANGGSPFGHSSCLDIRTFFLATAGTVFDEASKDVMPRFLLPTAPHTHDALDDAVEQGQLFANLFEWALHERRRGQVVGSAVPNWLAERVLPIA